MLSLKNPTVSAICIIQAQLEQTEPRDNDDHGDVGSAATADTGGEDNSSKHYGSE